MKILIVLLIIFGFTGLTCNQNKGNISQEGRKRDMAGHPGVKQQPLSPRKSAMTVVGKDSIRIDYAAPSVRGRVIWGQLVPYNKIWVTGAHMATWIQFDKPLRIAGKEIPPGKYALFTIPGQDTWTVIINKNWNQHQADHYKESEDVMRFNVKPERTNNMTEQLNYSIVPVDKNEGKITISWEKISISFEIRTADSN